MSDNKRNAGILRLRTIVLVSFAAFTVAGVNVAAGDPGKPAGPDGKNGDPPSASTDALAGYTRVQGPTLTVNGFTSATVSCPPGQLVFGGGESNSSFTGTVLLTDSFPPTTTSWRVYVKNDSAISETFTPYAICGS